MFSGSMSSDYFQTVVEYKCDGCNEHFKVVFMSEEVVDNDLKARGIKCLRCGGTNFAVVSQCKFKSRGAANF